MQKEIIELLNEIYKNESESCGIEYFNQYLNELKKYDFAKLVAYLVSQSKFSLSYVLGLILSTPSLWINFSETDWIRLMSMLNPRPKAFSKEIFDTGYVDIHFLCKYLRVNAVDMFLQQEEFSNEDKQNILQYSKKVTNFLFMDELDTEDLDGDYFVHKEVLENYSSKLINDKKLKPFNYSENELTEYINRELKKI